jgi:D-alanine-D-alanine ligase
VEIRPVGSPYFDFHAKYDAGGSQEICPAPISTLLSDQIQAVALKVHRLVGCRGMSRTDMILSNGSLQVLETNTLPGLTKASLLPKSFACRGGTFFAMADIFIKTALAMRAKKKP